MINGERNSMLALTPEGPPSPRAAEVGKSVGQDAVAEALGIDFKKLGAFYKESLPGETEMLTSVSASAEGTPGQNGFSAPLNGSNCGNCDSCAGYK